MIGWGCRKFVVVGCAGALSPKLKPGHLVVPTSAVRDEGTSYHYLPASRTVGPTPRAVRAVARTLRANRMPFVFGKTWTTDAFYRETRAKVCARRAEGCLTVEMEASAFFAVAKFRRVQLAQILYVWDELSADEWKVQEGWGEEKLRRKLFDVAGEAVLKL